MIDLQTIWTEKYRPRTLDDIVLAPADRLKLEQYKTDKTIPHLLLEGRPGIGKTTLAKIIADDMLGCQKLYINASDESGIDVIRTKVSSFAQTKSIDGGIKIVILDEGDGISGGGQRALRNVMEEFSKYCRFIITANYKHRIVTPIRSRCQEFPLTPPFDAVVQRCVHILNQEKVKVPADQKALLLELIRTNYPDLRKCINNLQKYTVNGVLAIVDNELEVDLAGEIFNLLSSDIKIVRRHLIENESSFYGDYPSLMKSMLDYIYTTDMESGRLQECILIISEYMYRSAFVIDQEINFTACLVQLKNTQK